MISEFDAPLHSLQIDVLKIPKFELLRDHSLLFYLLETYLYEDLNSQTFVILTMRSLKTFL